MGKLMENSRTLIFALCLLAQAPLWASSIRTFPGEPWSKLKLYRTSTEIGLLNSSNRVIATIHGEPTGISLKSVKAEISADGLCLDAGKAIQDGMIKLVMNTIGLNLSEIAGKTYTLETHVIGPRESAIMPYFEGHGPKPVGHFYRSITAYPKGRARMYPLVCEIPQRLNELHIRFDITKQKPDTRICLKRFRYGLTEEIPVQTAPKRVKPELLFAADFEGDARANFAKGDNRPTKQRNLAYAPGISGQAVRLTARDKSLLEYAINGNVDPVRGTVAMWIKREWNFNAANQPWRTLFAFPWSGNASSDRVGSGALWFWFFGKCLRGDQSDDEDQYRQIGLAADGRWTHVVFEWDESGVRLFVNGRRQGGTNDSSSPMIEALRTQQLVMLQRSDFKVFTVGSRGDSEQADALIDDLRIYSAPLGSDAVQALWREHRATDEPPPPPRPDYAKIFAGETTNAYECASLDIAGVPGEMELVDSVSFTADAIAKLGRQRFSSVGEYAFGELNGTAYLELGEKAGSRFAVHFKIDTNAPLYCFEFDYPDNAKRTADLIVQPCNGGDYILQVGYAAGDEYPNTGKIITHRCLYWSHTSDVAAVLMTARSGAPAALSAIRLYRVKANALPMAKINEPKANAANWHRSVALYFEDPAVGYDFGISAADVASPTGVGKLIERVAAKMKYTGENVFAYPGAWYHGLINDEYNPRNHAPDFLQAWYEKFGKEGLGVVPTINPNTMPVEEGLVTRETMSNGALHPSEIAIHDTGKPNWGKWHDTPPNFNFHHPKVRAHIEGIFDTLLRQGEKYPAFRGICLHMTRHCMLWFGDEISGYNDYTIRAFAKDCAIDLPFEKFASRPLRGRDYAEWIRANCRERFIQWRCDQVTAFYVRLAKKLAAARPDLKLWLNSFVPADHHNADFLRPDYMYLANRRCGLDSGALTKGAGNIILCQTVVPADYRFRTPDQFPSTESYNHQRIIDTLPGFYSLLKGADYPWVNQHDRYWESAIGRLGGSLSCQWMKECAWRVTTINPSGRNALRHFVQPLRYNDVLGLSKGGFLIGTYGMEDALVPFFQAFRALPAVCMDEVGRVNEVVARQRDFDGKSYFYIVNTGLGKETIRVTFPQGTKDLVSGERPQTKATARLRLMPYEMKSFVAPKGKPAIKPNL